MILTLIACIAATLGIAGQEADSLTTYFGVKKFGASIEGDKAWFAQWSVKHTWTLLWLKATVFGAIEALLIWAGPHTGDGGTFIAMTAGFMGAVMGADAAYSNYKINQAK